LIKKFHKTMKKKTLITLIVGVAALVFSFFFDDIVALSFHTVQNSFFDVVFSWTSNVFSVLIILFIITSLFLYEEKKREWIPFLWLSFLASIVIGYILKFMVARPRPFDFLPLSALNFETAYSFPSMHAMVAFCALPILDKEFRQIKWFWIIFAALIAFSRIYIGVHYISDVIAGAIIGYLIGWLFMKLELKERFFRKWNQKS